MKKLSLAVFLLSSLTACGGSGTDSASSSPQNQKPVANAGIDQNVVTTSLVTLDASASSDSDGDVLSYSWSLTTLPANSSTALNSTSSALPTFTTDIDGTYVAQLIVNDGTEDSVSDTVTIVAATANSIPVANAGIDQNVVTTSLVTLDASASSDSDGDVLSYSWSLTTLPTNSSASLSNPSSALPTFTADIDGSYVAQLIVSDGTEDSVSDTVTIVSATANSIPVANAGADQDIVTTFVVTLDSSASSDADGDELSYIWSFVSKPTGSNSTLDNEQIENPSFTPDLDGSYVIGLIVNDGLENSVSDNVTINAIQPRVKLYSRSFSGSTFNEYSLPYSSNGTVSTSVSGVPAPTIYSLGTFKLLAEGQNFTITNVVVADNTSQVIPYFTVISEDYELIDGTEVEFELISPLTRGATVMLNFSFEIQETGDTFSSSYTFTSN